MSSLGRNLKELRQQLSLNQKDLSDRSGVSQATISRIETGRVRQLGSSALKSLADALGVSTDDLIDEKGRLTIARDITAEDCQQGAISVLQAGYETGTMRDLGLVVRTLGDELEAMGIQFEAVGLQIIDEQRNRLACYRAYAEARGYGSVQTEVPLQESLARFASLRRLVSHWHRHWRRRWHPRKVWEREADEDFRQMAQEIFSDSIHRPRWLIDVPFAQGMLGLELPLGELNSGRLATILDEFAHSISLVVKRLFELQSLREELDSTRQPLLTQQQT